MATDTQLFYWIIVRKSDKTFMPIGRTRGFTRDEPTLEGRPRMFVRRRDAESALRHWLTGVQMTGQSSGFDDMTFDEHYTVVRPERDADDMEVVRVLCLIHRE